MNDKKISFLLLILVAFFPFSSTLLAEEKLLESKWTPNPVHIDGQESDWSEEAFISDSKLGVDYAFVNDENNLYVLFVFKDPKALSTIEATGMSIWVNPEGKKNKDYGVKFLQKFITADQLIADLEKKGEVLSEERKSLLRQRKAYVLFDHEIISKKKKAQAGAEASEEKPAFRPTKKGKITIYEFRIPFASLGFQAVLAQRSPKGVKVGFEWGGMTPEMRQREMARRAEMGTRARATDTSLEESIKGGEENLDMGGAGGGPGLPRGPKKYSFWVGLKLARNQ